MRIMSLYLLVCLCLLAVCATAGSAKSTDKTLVSWVCLADTNQQGGSALTIQCADQFDAIVFGERVAGRWMAGSNFYLRTQPDQSSSPEESTGPDTLIQMAIVYQGDRVTVYRSGRKYASYETKNIDLLSPSDNMAVFGLRHQGAGFGQTLRGAIEDARIYDKALTPEEIAGLQPNIEGSIKPYAWWTFEKAKQTDRMGRFPVNTLSGGAKIEGGRLVLQEYGATMFASSKAIKAPGTASGVEKPEMPATPPADWPTYHLVHPGPGVAMPGDPNCAFYWKGEYHLHYIYNNNGFNFAHLSSKDLVHWKWHPTTLTRAFTGHGMFSGTGFFTKEGQPAIIYHGEGSGRNQIAIALDDKLEKWAHPYPIEPLTPDGKVPDMRHWDPDCWLNGDTYYSLSGGGDPVLLKSKDLKHWTYIGHLLHDDFPDNLGVGRGEDISCGNMFKIGNKWMLLCISHGLGCRYYLGDFKDEKYVPTFHSMMSWNGNNYFAPESVLAKDGRRVMWAWLMNLPLQPSGIQSLPRELELPADGKLRIRPLKELEMLRYDAKQVGPFVVKDGAQRDTGISGSAVELRIVLKPSKARESGLDVLTDKNGANGLRVALIPERGMLKVGNVEAPFALKPGEDLTLRVFVDKNLVEVFANDRQAAAAAIPFVAGNTGVRLFSTGADTDVKQLDCWKMKSIYTGKSAK